MQKTATNTCQILPPTPAEERLLPTFRQSGSVCVCVCVLRLDNFKNQQDICVFITSKCILTAHKSDVGGLQGCDVLWSSGWWCCLDFAFVFLIDCSALQFPSDSPYISLTCHCTQLKSLCRDTLLLLLLPTLPLPQLMPLGFLSLSSAGVSLARTEPFELNFRSHFCYFVVLV